MDAFLGGFATLGLLIVAIPLALIILGLAIVFNGRREEDPTGLRTTSVYFGLVNFIALVILIFGVTSIMGSLSSLIVDEDDRASSSTFDPVEDFGGFDDDFPGDFDDFGSSDDDANDRVIRETIQGGLLVVPALLVFLFHWRRREAFVASPEFAGSPALRVDRIYLYAICFVTALLGSIAVGRMAYDVFRVIIPQITSDLDFGLERRLAISDLLTMGVLAASSIYVFFWHWKLVSGESELWRRLLPDRTPADPQGVVPGTPPPSVGGTPPPPSGPGLAEPPSTPPGSTPPPPDA